jgi:PAS domain S-box-containing protein
MPYNDILVRQAPSAIAMFDREMRYLAVSEKWINDYKLQGKEIIGKSHYEIFPEIGDDWKSIHKECLAGAINRNDNAYFLRNDGSEQWLSWDVRPWHLPDGEIGGIIMYTEDITQRKLVETNLSISEAQFRGVFDNSAIGIAVVSLSGKWLKVNKALCHMLGHDENELTLLTLQNITHPEDLERDLDLVKDLLDGTRDDYRIEKRYKHKKGHYLWALLTVSIVRSESGKPRHFVSQITDITEIRVIRQKLEGILEASSQVSIISTDINGTILSFNTGAENLLGYSRNEMINVSTPEKIHVQEEVALRSIELSAQFGERIAGFETFIKIPGINNYETREWTYIKKDGTRIPVLLTVTAIKDKNEITGYLGVAVNIEETKRAEAEMLTLLEVTRKQNNRLKNFAHIVSHNLRSHSSNISILVDLIANEYAELGQSELFLNLERASQNLLETIGHLNDIVLLNTSPDDSFTNINLRASVESTISSVAALANEKGVYIENSVKESVSIWGVKAYVDSILVNLLTNGIKYSSPVVQQPYVRIDAQCEGKSIVVSCEDNGLGMDLEKIGGKLFGMYKTFHNHKEARGIGLFLTKNQVEAMGGKITVESTPGFGTTFRIYLRNGKD